MTPTSGKCHNPTPRNLLPVNPIPVNPELPIPSEETKQQDLPEEPPRDNVVRPRPGAWGSVDQAASLTDPNMITQAIPRAVADEARELARRRRWLGEHPMEEQA
jgi:hypothetical protein